MSISFGLALPAGPPKNQIDRWLTDLDLLLPKLEDHFDSLWMTDHFFWEEDPTYEAWTVLSFLAARYPQFKIGPMVMGQSYRNPALLAKMGATLQALCDGRFIMAIGAGWKEDEYHAYGYPFPRAGIRLEQLEDTLEILKRMWTEPGKVSYAGKHYQIADAYCEPKPDPVPPIVVGGGGRKTMALAAKYADWWNMPDASFEDYHERVRILREHCAAIGREPATLRLTWFGRVALGRSEEEALALSDGRWHPGNAFAGTPDQVVEEMERFIDLGVDGFMVEPLGLADPVIQAMLLEEVVPRLKT